MRAFVLPATMIVAVLVIACLIVLAGCTARFTNQFELANPTEVAPGEVQVLTFSSGWGAPSITVVRGDLDPSMPGDEVMVFHGNSVVGELGMPAATGWAGTQLADGIRDQRPDQTNVTQQGGGGGGAISIANAKADAQAEAGGANASQTTIFNPPSDN